MKTKLFIVALISLALFITGSCASDSEITKVVEIKPEIIQSYSYSEIELETMDLINEYRVSEGLNALIKSNYLSYKAEEHDYYMIQYNLVNHDNFIDRSQNIINVLGARRVSENIAYNYKSPKAAVDAWLLSTGHKKVIDGNFTHFGISIRENPINGRKYYTNIFIN